MLQVMPADAGLKFRMKYGPRWNYIRLTLLKATLTDLSLAQKEIYPAKITRDHGLLVKYKR